MAIKVRVSYERPQELHTVVRLLQPVIKSYKIQKGGNGRYKKAYLDIEMLEEKVQKSVNKPLI